MLSQPLDLESTALSVLKTWQARDYRRDFSIERFGLGRGTSARRWVVVLYDEHEKRSTGQAPRLDTAVREAIGGPREYDRHRW